MNTFITLPSNRIVQIDDIIYVSDVKNHNAGAFLSDKYSYSIDIVWANRVKETFTYLDLNEAQADYNILKSTLMEEKLPSKEPKYNLVCS